MYNKNHATSDHTIFCLEFDRSEKGKYCQFNTRNVLKEFIPVSTSIEDAIISRDECENYCNDKSECWGCSVHCGSPCQWNAIPECGVWHGWGGLIDGDITQKPLIPDQEESGRLINQPYVFNT